jgi:sterol desaturase/sphingolipid hydroxylase (fatty acid hydroxylase superfamily)
MVLILVTLGVLAFGIGLGFIYSYLIMYTKLFDRFKIRSQQLEMPLSRAEFYKRVPLISINLVSLFLISGVGLYFGGSLFNMEWTGIGIFVLHFLAILFIDDLMFYFIHRSLHDVKFLHQKVHSIHHQASQPFPLDFIYAHPVEWLSGYAGAFVGVLVINGFTPVDVYAFWLWGLFRSLHELDIHSGVRSVVSKYIPLMAGAEHHDFHHLRSKGNYSSTLILWDWVFGTTLKRKGS